MKWGLNTRVLGGAQAGHKIDFVPRKVVFERFRATQKPFSARAVFRGSYGIRLKRGITLMPACVPPPEKPLFIS